jgi:sugar (glycoside-pentoside-hexuronide) transporter
MMGTRPIELVQPPVSGRSRLSFWEKSGYAVGDIGANFIFQTMIMFQLAFYTDTFGITAASAATLLATVRLWDAVFDPLIGVVADRSKTRWGRFRPWILWTAAPLGLLSFLTFTTPHFSSSGKLVYAYLTYIGLMMLYSANNVPYSALSGVMTGDPVERTALSSYRFVFAMIAQLVIQGLALPMIHYFGKGDSARGYQSTIGVFSLFAIVFFVIAFLSTKERIHPTSSQCSSVRQDMKALLGSGPWRTMFVVTVVLFMALAMRGSVVLYYFKYYVGREDLFSAFNVLGTAASIAGIFFSQKLAVRYGKRDVFVGGLALTAFFTALFVAVPGSAIRLMFTIEIARQFVYGLTIPLLWAAMGDVADYSEWKRQRRATGMVFSAIVFGLKAGLGFGGAISSYVLSVYGYLPNGRQSAHALEGIRMAMSLFPAAIFVLCVWCVSFYSIGKETEIQMTRELALSRARAGDETI